VICTPARFSKHPHTAPPARPDVVCPVATERQADVQPIMHSAVCDVTRLPACEAATEWPIAALAASLKHKDIEN